MKIRTLLDNERKEAGREIKVELKGSGGELGIKHIQHLTELIKDLKRMKTEQEVNDHYAFIMGYCHYCENSKFIDEKSAEDLMALAAVLAGNELKRVKEA